jgi:hypothetical protein
MSFEHMTPKMIPPKDGEVDMPNLRAPKLPTFGRPKKQKDVADLPVPTVPKDAAMAGRSRRPTVQEGLEGRTIPAPKLSSPDAPEQPRVRGRMEQRRAGLFYAENFLRVHSIIPPPKGKGGPVMRTESDPEYVLNLRPLLVSAVEDCLLREPELARGLDPEDVADRLLERGIAGSEIFPARSRTVPIHHLDADHIGRFYDGVVATVLKSLSENPVA